MCLRLHRLGRLGRRSVRILYYHSISDAPMRSSVSPSLFAAQMELLAGRGYAVLALSDAVHRLAARGTLPQQAVVVTLDDGFRDNYDHAMPVLQRLGLPATVFLTAGYIGTSRLPTLTRTTFMPEPLDWKQVREMARHGIEFGSHTCTHPLLSQLPREMARRELGESRRVIENEIGQPVSLFCYPRGDFDHAVKALVREEGYVAACSTRPGVNDAGGDLYALRRTYVSRNDTPREFLKKLEGAYDLPHKALHLWRRVRLQ